MHDASPDGAMYEPRADGIGLRLQLGLTPAWLVPKLTPAEVSQEVLGQQVEKPCS